MIDTLTKRLKILFLPLLIQRDGGFICWYCKKPLFLFKYIYEHLNDNRKDNRIENLVLACDSCNNKKSLSTELKHEAMQKLTQNEQSNFLKERKFLIDELTKEASVEIEINVSNAEITKEFITQKVDSEGHISFLDALNCSVYLCKEKTGHGSQQSVRNYIKTLTCEIAPFMIVTNANKGKIIVRRKIENDTTLPISLLRGCN